MPYLQLYLAFASCFFIAERKINTTLPAISDTSFYFADSTDVGLSRHNKIELVNIATDDSSFMVINFYRRNSPNWKRIQQFKFISNNPYYDPQLSDFNRAGIVIAYTPCFKPISTFHHHSLVPMHFHSLTYVYCEATNISKQPGLTGDNTEANF